MTVCLHADTKNCSNDLAVRCRKGDKHSNVDTLSYRPVAVETANNVVNSTLLSNSTEDHWRGKQSTGVPEFYGILSWAHSTENIDLVPQGG